MKYILFFFMMLLGYSFIYAGLSKFVKGITFSEHG